MLAVTAEPLEVAKVFALTGHDACVKMGKYDVRIMNYTSGQTKEVCDVVEWQGYQWGIVKLNVPQPRYGYIAFLLAEPLKVYGNNNE